MLSQTYNITPATETDKALFYSGSERENHCAGHVRGHFGRSGTEYNASFWQHAGTHLAGDDFMEELNMLLAGLRRNLLKSRGKMNRFILEHPPLILETGVIMSYGYQVSTEKYDYYIRCAPYPGCYDFYIYAYIREA